MKALLLALVVVLCVQPAFAIDTAPAFSDPVQQARYDQLIRELRCVQCRSQSIADSNVGLAADLRREVRELMAAGKSDQEILTYGSLRRIHPLQAAGEAEHMAVVGGAGAAGGDRRCRGRHRHRSQGAPAG
jgi:hypothetical protein